MNSTRSCRPLILHHAQLSMDKQCLFRSPTLISDTQEFQMTIFGGNPFNNPHRISEVYHLVASASIPYHGYEVSDAAGGPTAASMKCTNKVPVASVSRITGMFWEWLHFNNRCHLRCHQINHICDGITIHLTPESLQNRSFHLGSGSSRTYSIADTRPPRSQQRDQNCIYQHLCRSLLIRCSSSCHTRRPKLPTVHIDIAIYTKELW